MSRKSRPKPFPMQVVLGTKTREEWCGKYFCGGFFLPQVCLLYGLPRHFSFRFFPRSVVWSRSGGTSQPNDTYLAQTLVWDLRRWFSTGGVVGKKFMENPVHVDEQFQSFTWYWETISICHYIAIMSHCPPLTGSWFVGSMLISRHPAPVDMVDIPLFTRFYTCKRWLALGFLNHQQ